MGEFAVLSIDGYELTHFKNHPFGYGAPEWLTIFRDGDRIKGRRAYQCAAADVRDRLEVMGFTMHRTEVAYRRRRHEHIRELRERRASMPDIYDEETEEEIKALAELDFKTWMHSFAQLKRRSTTLPYGGRRIRIDPVTRVLKEVPEDDDYVGEFGFPHIDPRFFLRAVVEVVEGRGLITFDYSDLVTAGYLPRSARPCADAETFLLGDPSAGRVVVLTEGTTDRRALVSALEVLAPHLVDYFAFFDFEGSNAEGGAGALVRMIRAFAGAGIRNRTIAVFDNDTAARAALSSLRNARLPKNLRILRLPPVPLGKRYPTVGPSGRVAANINGRAGSIELYFGEDVLRRGDGSLTPVRWRSLDAGSKAWHGNFDDKARLQKAFDQKVQRWRGKRVPPTERTWDAMRAIINRLVFAFADS
jgi:hypothetical protein